MERTGEERAVAGLSHLAILFNWIGLIINVVLYIVYRSRSSFVAGHVKQALGLQVTAILVGIVVSLIFGFSALGVGLRFSGAALGTAAMGALLALLVTIAAIVLSVIAAIRGFQGQEYRHPIIGGVVARIGE